MGVIGEDLRSLKRPAEIENLEEYRQAVSAPERTALDDALARYKAAWETLVAFDNEPENELPQRLVDDVKGLLPELAQALDQFQLNGPSNPSAASQFVGQINTSSQEILRVARPHVRGGSVAWAAELEEARVLRERVEKTRAEVDDLAQATRAIAERTGTGQLAKSYHDEAGLHEKAARRWLIASTVLVLGLIGVGLWIYHGTPKSGSWQTYATAVGAKAFVVGAISYALVFCTRGYRSNKHLQAVYRQRSSALDTYNLMAIALAEDEQGRGIVLTKLAEAIFVPTDTGMATTSGGDRTIVETTIPLLSSMYGPASK